MKSRNTWLREGDKNTKFFHAQTMQRRRSNRIQGLEDQNGVWHQEDKCVQDIVVNYFVSLFKSEVSGHGGEVTGCVETKVSDRDNEELIRPFTHEEIREIVFSISANKSPGPDGFTASFFHDHWEVVGGM